MTDAFNLVEHFSLSPLSHQEVTHYLVKWCSLPYEESTWELEEDVDPAKVKEFESLQVLPEIKHVVIYQLYVEFGVSYGKIK